MQALVAGEGPLEDRVRVRPASQACMYVDAQVLQRRREVERRLGRRALVRRAVQQSIGQLDFLGAAARYEGDARSMPASSPNIKSSIACPKPRARQCAAVAGTW